MLAAALAAAEYEGPEPDLIVVSPEPRAKQTAEPFIARFPGVEVETWPIQEFTYLSPARCVGTTAEPPRFWLNPEQTPNTKRSSD